MRSSFLVSCVAYVLAGLVVVHVAMRQKSDDENRNVNMTEHIVAAAHSLKTLKINTLDIRLVCHVVMCGSLR